MRSSRPVASRVDGSVVALGASADPAGSRIEVDGRRVDASSARTDVHLVCHKPIGVTSTVRDRHAQRTVVDLVPAELRPPGARIYPVGRLDLESEGVLLLTNDGTWAERVLHPRYGVEREYAIGLARALVPEQVRMLEHGIRLDEGHARFLSFRPATRAQTRATAALLDPPPGHLAWYRATLGHGWRRQIRRMLAAAGAPIERLVRVRIGPVGIAGLLPGAVRPLTDREIELLAGHH